MKWSIPNRLTTWYAVIVVAVLVAGAAGVAFAEWRLGVRRLEGELARLLLTLEGVMHTEFSEGLSLQAAVDEASVEVVAPDRALVVAAPDGRILAAWGRRTPSTWLPPLGVSAAVPYDVNLGGARWRAVGRTVDIDNQRYVAAVLAPLDDLTGERAELLVALSAGVVIALVVAAAGGAIIRREAMRPLEAALRAQRQFMADASHEMRTPTSVVRTTAQVTLGREHRSDAEYRDALGIVAEQSARLTRLVDAMFLLSRSEAHGLPLIRQPVYVNDIVTECVRSMRVLADARGIALELHGEPDIPMQADDGLLRQLFGNLLDNAIRHARSAVTVMLERGPETAAIRVANDGPPVPDEDRERIFERFVRLEQSPGGAGLGLPIARRIAEAHGGQLVLEKGPTGVCFTVTLPINAHAADSTLQS